MISKTKRSDKLDELIRAEQHEYDFYAANLGLIVKAGLNNYLWIVKTDVAGLPLWNRNDEEGSFLRSPAMWPSESSKSYLKRVFSEDEGFNFYRFDNLLIANKFGLALYFSLEEEQRRYRQNFILFTPYYTNNKEIGVELLVRTNQTNIGFNYFSRNINIRSVEDVPLPETVGFVGEELEVK